MGLGQDELKDWLPDTDALLAVRRDSFPLKLFFSPRESSGCCLQFPPQRFVTYLHRVTAEGCLWAVARREAQFSPELRARCLSPMWPLAVPCSPTSSRPLLT